MIDYKSKIAQKLLQINAINLNYKEPFTWASGIKSPIYCDNRKSLSDIEARNLICEGFQEASASFGQIDVIAGVATGGIAHGMLLADRLELPFIYVRTAAKSHGLKNAVEGRLLPGQRVLVIEDLISTGGSSYQAIEALIEAGAQIAGMLAIFSYGFEESKKLFEDKGIQVITLSDYDTLLNGAVKSNMIPAEQMMNLMEWKKDPKAWRQ